MAVTLDSFMRAIAGQESGGDYGITNRDSGAHGKYQILPSNWPSWSAEAGIPGAPQTPENQERVARFKIQQYYNQYGNWEDVASVWYSGQPLGADQHADQNGYPSIRSYVDAVMLRAGDESGGGGMPEEETDYGSIIDTILAELVKNQPKPGDFKDDQSGTAAENYQFARQQWTNEFTSLVKTRETLKNNALDIYTLPDGTVMAKGDLTPEQKAQIDASNRAALQDTLRKYGLEDIDAKNKNAQQNFANKITGINTGLATEDRDLARAKTELGRWLDAQGVAQGDATNIQEAKKLATQWGTTGGKTAFTAADLGEGVSGLARQAGSNMAAPLLKYPGYQTFDPVGDRQASMAAMGVLNAPPLLPKQQDRQPIPDSPPLLDYPSRNQTPMNQTPSPGPVPVSVPPMGPTMTYPPMNQTPAPAPGIDPGTGMPILPMPWLGPDELNPDSPNYIGRRVA